MTSISKFMHKKRNKSLPKVQLILIVLASCYKVSHKCHKKNMKETAECPFKSAGRDYIWMKRLVFPLKLLGGWVYVMYNEYGKK